MKRFSKKKTNKEFNDNSLQKINQQQQIFEKVSRTFTANYLRPSQHKKIMTAIHQQIKRPETSKNLRKDYKNLMDLADCNKIIVESRQRSMMSYKKMKNMNHETSQKRMYQTVFAQIQNTEGNLSKKKYEKYDLKKFKLYLKQQQIQQNSLEAFVQNALFQGMRDIKNYIPIQAKLHKKLCIFGTLLEKQKHHHVQQLKNMIIKQKQKTPNMSLNYQIYLINYYLMEKMMEKICSDSAAALQLKKRNSQIYSMIKNQMIGQIVNEKKFIDMLKIMQQHAQNQDKMKFQGEINRKSYNYHHKSRLKQKIKVGRHNRYGSDSQKQLINRQTSNKFKQNQLVLQFQRLYQQAEQRINQAKLELNFPSPRKNNFYSMIQMKPLPGQKQQRVF